MYDSQRFFVMTGNVIGDYEIIDGTEKVLPLYNKYLVKKKEEKRKPHSEVITHDAVILSDSDMLKKAQNSKNGTQFKLIV